MNKKPPNKDDLLKELESIKSFLDEDDLAYPLDEEALDTIPTLTAIEDALSPEDEQRASADDYLASYFSEDDTKHIVDLDADDPLDDISTDTAADNTESTDTTIEQNQAPETEERDIVQVVIIDDDNDAAYSEEAEAALRAAYETELEHHSDTLITDAVEENIIEIDDNMIDIEEDNDETDPKSATQQTSDEYRQPEVQTSLFDDPQAFSDTEESTPEEHKKAPAEQASSQETLSATAAAAVHQVTSHQSRKKRADTPQKPPKKQTLKTPEEQTESKERLRGKGANPFLPPHIRERIAQRDQERQTANKTQKTAFTTHSNDAQERNESNYDELIDEIVQIYLPRIEAELREKLRERLKKS